MWLSGFILAKAFGNASEEGNTLCIGAEAGREVISGTRVEMRPSGQRPQEEPCKADLLQLPEMDYP